MKFIIFYEVLDSDEMIKRFQNVKKLNEIAKEDGIPSGKVLSPPYAFLGLKNGFQLMEADDAQALALLAGYYYGTANFKFKPFIETEKVLEIQKTTTKALKS